MVKIPDIISQAAHELIAKYGNKLALLGEFDGSSVYQFKFPNDEKVGFPVLFFLKDDNVTEVTGFEALDFLRSL